MFSSRHLKTTNSEKRKPYCLTSSEGESESIKNEKREPNVSTSSKGEEDSMISLYPGGSSWGTILEVFPVDLGFILDRF